ncbi:CAP domain-containing protein [Granulicella sp. dw_53]|uniref:CAP domain-containing protein n=1 Tax=Granulicella sp. dw_53 TaxID=2719792 RepID=UPI001BD3D904|nr:CAP domain-containing protein [Granulicella sp. dw_53]
MYRPLPILCLIALTSAAPAQQTIAERYLLQTANQHRAALHLGPLTWDPALALAAQRHAIRISREPGPAEHQYRGEPDLLSRAAQAGAHFSNISENVAGNGNSPAEIELAWMNSPVHRANILDPQLNTVGIAVVQSRSLLSAVEDFGRNVPVLTPNGVEASAQQILLSHGIQPELSADARQDARRACNSQTTTGYLTQPTLIFQWEGPDLNDLPKTVASSLPRSQGKSVTHTAALAACPSTRPTGGFTTYRIAVLLY